MKGRGRYTRVRPGQEHHLAGVRALADGPCASIECDEPVLKEEQVVRHKSGGWMHVRHASGQDDE